MNKKCAIDRKDLITQKGSMKKKGKMDNTMDKYKELGEKLTKMFEEGKTPDDAAELIAKTLSCEVILTDYKNDIVGNYGSKIPINCLRYSMKTNGTLHLFSRDPENDDIYQEHPIRDNVLPALAAWFPGKQE